MWLIKNLLFNEFKMANIKDKNVGDNIALFFGSFNPLHKGHVEICRRVFNEKKFGIKKVWLVPSPQNPFKAESSLMKIEDRIGIIEAVIKNKPYLELCKIELKLKKPNYTYLTLQEINKIYPRERFSLILGEDNLKNLSTWKRSDWIIDNFHVIIIPRGPEGISSQIKKDRKKNSKGSRNNFKKDNKDQSKEQRDISQIYAHPNVSIFLMKKIPLSASRIREIWIRKIFKEKMKKNEDQASKRLDKELANSLYQSTIKYLKTKETKIK